MARQDWFVGSWDADQAVRTEGLRRGVRLGHAGLVGSEEQAVHVGQLHRVVICMRRDSCWCRWWEWDSICVPLTLEHSFCQQERWACECQGRDSCDH